MVFRCRPHFLWSAMAACILPISALRAEPLIVTEGTELPQVHCSIASQHTGTELWKMFKKPFIVVFDNGGADCLSVEEKLSVDNSDSGPPLVSPPGGVPPSWCYCRHETANLLRNRIQTLDEQLHQRLVRAEHDMLADYVFDSDNLPEGITKDNAAELFKMLGVNPDDTSIKENGQVLYQLKQDIHEQNPGGLEGISAN